MKINPSSVTIIPWLKSNLGKNCLAGYDEANRGACHGAKNRHGRKYVIHPFLRRVRTKSTEGFAFWCPACASIDPKFGLHVFTTKHPDPDLAWDFDGSASFEPSLAYENEPYCHLHLIDGKLRYYPDSTAFAGHIVDMVPIPVGEHSERE